jgi:putative heme-binding domain-containing protein
LIEDWPRQTPKLRPALLEALLSNPERILLFMDEMAAGRVRTSELDAARADRLLQHADERVRTRAAALFGAAERADRAAVLKEYAAALAWPAEAVRGREVFRKQCATCHRIGNLGVDVAPSIADERTKSLEQLLVDVLQPSRVIDNNFASYTVVTKDGRSLTGIIAAETAASVTLKQPEGKLVPLLRGDIEEIQSNGVSLMPDGLERTVSRQDMVDVLTFIKRWRYLDGAVPAAPGGK